MPPTNPCGVVWGSMDKATVIQALALLGRKAAARGLTPEIAIYGGTV
ncbi:MAG: hypothetical protein ACREH8_09620 [Opitutaceae bacterium]